MIPGDMLKTDSMIVLVLARPMSDSSRFASDNQSLTPLIVAYILRSKQSCFLSESTQEKPCN